MNFQRSTTAGSDLTGQGHAVVGPTDTPERTGLSAHEAAVRVQAGSTNTAPNRSSRSPWDIFRANVLTLFNGIVAGSFVLLLLLGQWRDALFGFAAVSNALIGVVQEYRAKRDGSVQEIDVGDVVQDDILVLRTGDQIPADALMLDAEGLEVDESLLTGESDAVEKGAGAEVLSGSSRQRPGQGIGYPGGGGALREPPDSRGQALHSGPVRDPAWA